MSKMLPAVTLVLFLSACTAPEWTEEALRKQGFTDITVRGYDFFACGEDDAFATAFVARNTNGDYVDGTVCCGLFKSCTVRW